MEVKRRDGTSGEFAREKIVVAVLKSGGALDLARSVASEVEASFSGRDAVTTEEIRAAVLSRLQTRAPEVYNGWVAYDKEKKGRQ